MPYKSDRVFKIWAYSVSHSFLLLRSTNNEEDEDKAMREGYNIDIEFIGVGYLDLPTILRGISIQEVKDGVPEKLKKYSSSLGYKVFEIKSEETYHVVAGNYIVGKNNWLNEDRIFDPNLQYDELLATSNSG